MKKISILLIYLISFIYMEFLYKIFIYENIFRLSIINMLLFLLPLSLLLFVITKLFKESKWNRIVFIIIMSVISVWFCAQYIVKDYYDFYISLSTFQVADQVGAFAGKAIIEILKRIPGVIAFFLPLIISLIFSKRINFKQNKGIKNVLLFRNLLSVESFFGTRFIYSFSQRSQNYRSFQKK